LFATVTETRKHCLPSVAGVVTVVANVLCVPLTVILKAVGVIPAGIDTAKGNVVVKITVVPERAGLSQEL
jgi:hypothetical protein